MCLGIPAKIIKITDKTSLVEVLGASREISIELLNNVKVGDYVLMHAGCAIQIIDDEEAEKTIELFRELKEIVNG